MAARGSTATKPRSVVLQPGADVPDLAEQVPTKLEVMTLRVAGRNYYPLAFQTVAENVAAEGDAELYIVGHRPGTNTPTMQADQYINIRDPHTGRVTAQQVVPNVGRLIFQQHLAGHDHWHFVDFETYTLYRAGNHRVFSRDHKIGFCLVSDVSLRSAHAARASRLAATDGSGLISYNDDTPGCGKHKPNLTRVIESINPLAGDVYEPFLGGQSVDVTNAPNGKYLLVIRVNPANRVVESDYSNDFASLLISIHRSAPRAKPTFRILKSCPGTSRCATG